MADGPQQPVKRRRRRFRLLETVATTIGILFAVVFAGSTFLVVFLVLTWGDADTTFPFGAAARASPGSVRLFKGLGIGIFAALAIVSWGVMDVFLDHPVSRLRGAMRRWRSGDER
ncbi:MAG: hypothetical protein ACRDHO_13050 [Actinomycetota bacterium]